MGSQDSSLRELQDRITKADLAAPLIQAFRDVEQEFVQIEMLKQIWPLDYERRNDRVAGLLVSLLGPPDYPSGLRILIPHGQVSFDIDLKEDGSTLFRCTRETDGQRPRIMEFVTREPWMEYFYRLIADVIQM